MIQDAQARCKAGLAKTIELRRALHQVPEIGLDLPKTQALTAAELTRLGIAYRAIGSGLVADIGTTGPLIGMRADMDALPVPEKNETAWKSTHEGRMHACGHDAHIASLLGAAALLQEEAKAGRLPFRARLIFQPGEEGYFGAQAMMAGGALEGVVAIEGGHVGGLSEELEPGQAGFMPGAMMAASDHFEASFLGSGGHGSAPHDSPDPIAAFADFVQAVYLFRARELDQRKAAVISICAVKAGLADNVIPDRADFGGTARSLDPALRKLLQTRIGEIGEATAKLWRLAFEYRWLGGYPPLLNDPRAAEAMESAAKAALGEKKVRRLVTPIMGGEDFAFYTEKVPGAFWFLNTQAPDRGIKFPNHNPRFELDESLLGEASLLHVSSAYALAQAFA